MSNVFNISEAYNIDVLIPITASGVARLLKKGSRVKFRDDLEGRKKYDDITLFEGEMSSVKGKVCIIKSVYFGVNRFTISENTFDYSFEMVEGVYLN